MRRVPPAVAMGRVLSALADATARAAGVPAPRLRGSGEIQCEQYALFSRACVTEALARGTAGELTHALRGEAWALGDRLRALAGIATVTEGLAVAARLYALIGIEFQADPDGRIHVSRCCFSRFYSPTVCGVMSAMDEGVLAGLTGEGRLSFTRRITEGHPACTGRFAWCGP
jgi:hypothetical protein